MLVSENWAARLAAVPRVRRQALRRLLDDPVAEVSEAARERQLDANAIEDACAKPL